MKPDRVVIGVDNDEAQRGDGRAVRAVHPPGRQPDPLHGHRLGRGHQVRGQRDAGHPHLVHEPDGRASASGSAPTCTTCGAASAPTSGSAARSCIPGPGYGGSCFPKDVKAHHPHRGCARPVARRAQGGRGGQRGAEAGASCRRRSSTWGTTCTGKIVGVWGLAFKAETDDMRESPTIPLIEGLLEAGARVQTHDPKATDSARAHLRRPGDVRRRSLQRRARRRRAADHDRVAGLPQSRLRAGAEAAAPPAPHRRPQPLRSRPDGRARASSITGSAGDGR